MRVPVDSQAIGPRNVGRFRDSAARCARYGVKRLTKLQSRSQSFESTASSTPWRADFRRVTPSIVLGLALAIATPDAQPVASLRTAVESYVRANQAAIVRELADLLGIPNVATDRPNMRRNAEHLRGLLARRGFAVDLWETPGNPLVYGERREPGAAHTILIYAHYDGQPVNPSAWKQSDPFQPRLRRGRLSEDPEGRSLDGVTTFDPDWRLFARSASDDKSPIVALLTALDALASIGRRPSANLRVILDGEEEAGSPNLVPAVDRHRAALAADLMLVMDGPAHSSGRPTLVFGARGIVVSELTVFGPRSGVHSGNYGNWVPNPALRLAHLLASMKDDAGRVKLEGFYEGIDPPSAEEQALMSAVPEDAALMLRTFGIAGPEVEGQSLQQALQIPTLNIRGLASAHVGEGARTIIPDRAVAALDIRLVKETPSRRMLDLLRRHIERQGYVLVDSEPDADLRARHPRLARLIARDPTEAFRTSPSGVEARRLTEALTQMFGEPPVRIRTAGGTVPIAPFVEALGLPAILVPTVNFDNNQHEENENLRLGHFFQAIVVLAAAVTM
jgi:acetylornithine deacetylase/succinyl-diaminopimelate desuccinylase-like protein